MAQELAAGRTLITAYLSYAAENNNRLMPAFDQRPNNVWFEPDKKELSGSGALSQMVYRYPYRLAPYFGYKMDGVILSKANSSKVQDVRATQGADMAYYETSAMPMFGINETFVGGKIVKLPTRMQPGEFGEYGYDPLSATETIGNTLGGRRIIVFASAGSGTGSNAMGGYFRVDSPTTASQTWLNSHWAANSDPATFGRVDARFEGRALCVFLDGSVESLTIDQLKDMRFWSKNAAEQDNPNYAP